MTADQPFDFQALVEQSPDATIVAGADGIIQVWNAAAERVFGFPAADAIGQDLNIIIPEHLQEQHWTAYDRAIAEAYTKYVGQSLPTRAKTASGKDIYVELSFGILKDAAGSSIGAIAQARDISERWERDRDMRRQLRSLQEAAGNTADS